MRREVPGVGEHWGRTMIRILLADNHASSDSGYGDCSRARAIAMSALKRAEDAAIETGFAANAERDGGREIARYVRQSSTAVEFVIFTMNCTGELIGEALRIDVPCYVLKSEASPPFAEHTARASASGTSGRSFS
jgi:DNA-binding NarL/FixJ family response regulator